MSKRSGVVVVVAPKRRYGIRGQKLKLGLALTLLTPSCTKYSLINSVSTPQSLGKHSAIGTSPFQSRYLLYEASRDDPLLLDDFSVRVHLFLEVHRVKSNA
jgi:hypothetical protein